MQTASLVLPPSTEIQPGDAIFLIGIPRARTSMHSDCFISWSDAKRRRLKKRAKARFRAKRR